jgi:Photosynthesis affected mutant 68
MSSKPTKKAQGKDSAVSPDGNGAKSSLPFEPVSTKKKSSKKASTPSPVKDTASSRSSGGPAKSTPRASSKTMPKVVSDRMARRMAFFCGIPSVCAMLTFVVSYVLINQGVKLPNYAVMLVSFGFFGLGVLGLSYGLISASWDESSEGSLLGGSEFRLNLGRIIASWREARELSKQEES